MPRNVLIIAALVLTSFSSRALAQTLTEWPLAASITAIDASQGRPIALGETTNQCLTDFDGNTVFTQYCSAALPFTQGDDLRALVVGSNDRYTWMSDRVNRRLARLHQTASPPYYELWTLPPGMPEPRQIDLDRQNGNVVFAAFDTLKPALIGYLVPGMPMANITAWNVSSVVTTGLDQITGLAFYRTPTASYAIFTVFGTHKGVGILDLTGQLQFWSVPFAGAVGPHVAIDSAGRALFSRDSATNNVDILDWMNSQQKRWTDMMNTSISAAVTVDRFDSPLFTAHNGGSYDVVAVNTNDGDWTRRVAPPWNTIRPQLLRAFWDRVDPIILQSIIVPTGMPINKVISPPFTYYLPTNGEGAISADLTSPLDVDVWFWEGATNRLARITP